MKTIKSINITPAFVVIIPDSENMEQGVIYISREYKTAVHLCLCGCKNQTVTPLCDRFWTLTESGNKISLSPSIGNYQFPCKSHYIISSNKANFV